MVMRGGTPFGGVRGRRRACGTVVVSALAVTLVTSLILLHPAPSGLRTSSGPRGGIAVRVTPAAPAVLGGIRPISPLGIAAGGGEGRIVANSTDGSIVPNDGLRLNITAFPSSPLPANSAYQVGAEEVIGSYEAVFGLFTNSANAATPFFSVFTNRTDLNVHLAYWRSLPLVPDSSYDFELARAAGTNWSLTVNGAEFLANASAATFDFGVSNATWLSSIGFSQVALYSTAPAVPAVVTVPLAFAVHQPSGWRLPGNAQAYFVGAAGTQWGVEGRVQHPTLAPGEVQTGSQVGNVTNGTTLWTGGPVQVRVGVAFATPSEVATVPIATSATVVAIGGQPLPGVSVAFADGLGGNFTPPAGITNNTGVATILFLTPNVSAPANDPVTATVTLFGYTGSGLASVALTPPPEVYLAPSPSHPVVPPGGSATIAFIATNAQGAPQAGVFLAFAVAGMGSVSPAGSVTDASGTARIDVAPASGSSSETVTATVTGTGLWGAGRVVIAVHGSSSLFDLLAGVAPYIPIVVVAAVIAVVVVLRRRRRRQIPAMPLREYAPGGGPTKGPDAPPVSRTPPSGGTP